MIEETSIRIGRNGHLSHNATVPSRVHRLAVDSSNIRQTYARVGSRASWLIMNLRSPSIAREIRAGLIGLTQRQRVVRAIGEAGHIACLAVRARLFLAHIRLIPAYRVATNMP